MIIDAKEFDNSIIKDAKIQKRRKGNPGNKLKIKYKDLVCAFDIETTSIDEIHQSVMYIWQFQIDDNLTVIGRTWPEFLDFCDKLVKALDEKEWLVVYVHNLSYEFSYLSGIYNFRNDEVFATEPRKILKCSMYDHIEFRCSYFHSNMSLRQYLDKFHVEHKKTELDYSVKRFSWTELTDEELEYCINDVKGLVEALKAEMKLDNDNLYDIPLTSTGYVRRDAKEAMRHTTLQFKRRNTQNEHVYMMLWEAFRGGNTHANRFYANHILEGVKSADRVSSYPTELIIKKYPITEFTEEGEISFDRLIQLINVRQKAAVIRIAFSNIKLANKYWGCPYLARDKCRNIKNGIYDNGRILEAEYLETTITDIDLKIIIGEYVWSDCNPYDVASARYGYLPVSFLDTVRKYYRFKTEYKGVAEMEMIYNKSKAKLNALYGMCAQNPVKQSLLYDDGEYNEDTKPIEELLTKHNRKSYLNYAWGVWNTAHARYELEEGIKLAGDSFVYCDTDSVKYLDDINWDKYNKAQRKKCLERGGYAYDPKGNAHYLGEFEYDGDYKLFSTMGAKKYVYVDYNDELHITIAGVNKEKGARELLKHGGITAFREGFIFKDGGGTEVIYNDKPEVTKYQIDDHIIDITSNCHIQPSTYTLGLTEEYRRLLSYCVKLKYAQIKVQY